MHELSICTSLAAIVERHAGGRPVTTVHLSVGQLRQVVPPTLEAAWGLVVADTPLAGSTLTIDHVPAVIRCQVCGTSTTIGVPVFRCGCGSTDVEVTSGEELLVRSIDVAIGDPV